MLTDKAFTKLGFEMMRIENDGVGYEFYTNGNYRIDSVVTFDGRNYHYRYHIMVLHMNHILGFNTLFLGYLNSEEELQKVLEQTGVINN